MNKIGKKKKVQKYSDILPLTTKKLPFGKISVYIHDLIGDGLLVI